MENWGFEETLFISSLGISNPIFGLSYRIDQILGSVGFYALDSKNGLVRVELNSKVKILL